MADLNVIAKELEQYQSTLSVLSWSQKVKSQAKTNFCNSNLEAFDFDKIKDSIDRSKKSFDALRLSENKIYCVEFKDQKERGLENQNVRGKYRDGIELLSVLFRQCNVDILQYKIFYFVVFEDYSDETFYRKRDRINKRFSEKEQDESVKFGLDEEREKLLKYGGVLSKVHEKIKISTRPKKDYIQYYQLDCL